MALLDIPSTKQCKFCLASQENKQKYPYFKKLKSKYRLPFKAETQLNTGTVYQLSNITIFQNLG